MTESGRHRLEFTPEALRLLGKLDRPNQVRIKNAVDGLSVDPRPHGVVKLTDQDNAWRIRVGDFRIVYSIFDDILLVTVVWVGNRRDAY